MVTESIEGAVARPSRLDTARETAWKVTTSTVGACFRYRVTGLAAEAAFFAILSVPPLVFGLAGSISFIVRKIDPGQIEAFRASVIDLSSKVLTQESVDKIVAKTLNDVLVGQRFDIISIGFILSLWSGSRALHVFVDTITIMYGLGGRRGIVRTRMLSFSLYVVGLIVGVVVLPLVLAGPRLVDRFLPSRLDVVNALYWPTVIVVSIAFLASLFHLSVPVRTSWRHDLPGATLAFAIWVLGSYLLRVVLESSTTSIYGPLAAPIAVLIWLYVTALAVLIGAALNASIDRLWPEVSTARARLEGAGARPSRDIDDV
jgi:membrane protein